MRKCSKYQLCENKKDETAIRECQHFINLFEAEWTIKISFRSLTSLGSKKQTKKNYVSQRMRQLARLLQTLRKENEAANFDDFIDTARFDELVAAVKDLCGFKEKSRLDIDVPSLALKLGHSIKQCAQVLKSSALRKKDEAAIRECQNFIEHQDYSKNPHTRTPIFGVQADWVLIYRVF